MARSRTTSVVRNLLPWIEEESESADGRSITGQLATPISSPPAAQSAKDGTPTLGGAEPPISEAVGALSGVQQTSPLSELRPGSRRRINDLATELGVRSRLILDSLPSIGVYEKKTHTSGLEADEVRKVTEFLRARQSEQDRNRLANVSATEQSVAALPTQAREGGLLGDEELWARLSPSSRVVLAKADGIRQALERKHLHTEYLIAVLFSSWSSFFARAGVTEDDFSAIIQQEFAVDFPRDYYVPSLSSMPPLHGNVREALLRAAEYADERGAREIGSRHLLYGALSVHKSQTVRALFERGVRKEDIRSADGPDPDRPSAPSEAASQSSAALEDTSFPPMPPLVNSMPQTFPGYTDLPPLTASPTPKVDSDLWCEVDRLGYEAYARTIASLITHKETVAPLTIGIKAPWGAGKTSLMKRVQHLLDGYAELSEASRTGILQELQPSQVTLRDLLRELKASTKPPGPSLVQSKEGKSYQLSPRITVWFNAWKYQTSEQIWAGMAHCIISQVTARMAVKDRELFWLRLHGRRINAEEVRKRAYGAILRKLLPMALLVIAVCAIAFWVAAATPLGVPWRYLIRGASVVWGAYRLTKEWGNKLSEKAADTVRELIREPDYEGKMGYLHLVESDIREVLQLATEASVTKEKPNGDPLVVFVDDLDRCAPNKVAEVVEAINLFLCGDYPNCIFVLAMEPGMVAAALEVANKEVIEKALEMGVADRTAPVGWRFMEKIVQLPISIPPPTLGGRKSYVEALTGVHEWNTKMTEIVNAASAAPPPSPANLAGALDLQMPADSGLAKILGDEVKARALAQEPLKEEEVAKYMGELKGRSLGEVEEKSAKVMAEAPVEMRRAVAEASKRIYAQTFSERDPAMAEFVKEVAELVDGNPRQIKRYVNVFRFYSTLRHSLRVDGTVAEAELPTDKLLAKFLALSIQWPHAVDCLRVKNCVGADGGAVSRLEFLEMKSAEINGDAAGDEAWNKIVGTDGMKLGAWAEARAFRAFLAKGESLGKSGGHGLW
ncbi:MAG TPA: P-loop NTPase fold protein [Candidatus Sulfotelmatobacter sp.]